MDIKNTINEVPENILLIGASEKKDWMTQEIIDLMEQRRQYGNNNAHIKKFT
ncbi:hypothetical protein HHI36_012842, partial [Cryptolaemus montrouzieri]